MYLLFVFFRFYFLLFYLTYEPKDTQRFKFGFEFLIFEYLSFEFEYFANLLLISNKII